jgi:hypothetical protein
MRIPLGESNSWRLLDVLGDVIRRPIRGLEGRSVFSWSSRRGAQRTVHFQTQSGSILVHLFANMSQGRFSGRIELLPTSTDPTTRREQLAELSEYYLQLGGVLVAAGSGTIEAELLAGYHSLALTNDWGRELARTSVTVVDSHRQPCVPDLQAPRQCQAGDAVQLNGTIFDGRCVGVFVELGQRQLELLAVNQNSVLIAVPDDLLGEVTLHVVTPLGETSERLRVLQVRIECRHEHLRAGEATSLVVSVAGATGDQRVRVVNHAPGVLSIGLREVVDVTIAVGGTHHERAVALRPGSYAVSAQLEDAAAVHPSIVQSARAAMIAGTVQAVSEPY